MVRLSSFTWPALRRAGSSDSAGTTAVGTGVPAAKVAWAVIMLAWAVPRPDWAVLMAPATVARAVAAAEIVLTTGTLTFGTGLHASTASSSRPRTKRSAKRGDMWGSLLRRLVIHACVVAFNRTPLWRSNHDDLLVHCCPEHRIAQGPDRTTTDKMSFPNRDTGLMTTPQFRGKLVLSSYDGLHLSRNHGRWPGARQIPRRRLVGAAYA